MAESDRVEYCWVEVYSDETLQTRLKAGYVSNQGLLWEKLANRVPWIDVKAVYMCEPEWRFAKIDSKIMVYNEDTYRKHHAEEDFLDYVAARCARSNKEIFESWPKRMLIVIKRPDSPGAHFNLFDLCLQRVSE